MKNAGGLRRFPDVRGGFSPLSGVVKARKTDRVEKPMYY
jgi:hypothetical protein